MRLQAGKICGVLAAVVGAGVICASAGWAQDAAPKPETKATPIYSDDARRAVEDAKRAEEDVRKAAEDLTAAHTREFQFKFAPPMLRDMKFEISGAAKIRKAAEELRDAKDDAAKAKASDELRLLLDKYFEDDMANRQKELEGVEARLQKLHAQLERRRARKQDIIDLQMKLTLNEADGLGFYGQPSGEPFNIFYSPGPVPVETGNLFNPPAPAVSVIAPAPPAPPAAGATVSPSASPSPTPIPTR